MSVGIKDGEREGKAKLKVVSQGEEPVEFWLLLGGMPPSLASSPLNPDESWIGRVGRQGAKLLLLSLGEPSLSWREVRRVEEKREGMEKNWERVGREGCGRMSRGWLGMES